MIKSVKHKGLQELLEKGKSQRVSQDQIERIKRRLSILNSAESLDDIDLPGFRLHSLHTNPVRYSISVNGPWRLTFEWDNDVYKLDLEQYH